MTTTAQSGLKRPWTTTDHNKFMRLYPTADTKDLAKELGRTVESLHRRAYQCGVKKRVFQPNSKSFTTVDGLRFSRKWTDIEDKMVVELYPSTPGTKLANILKRPVKNVRRRADALGVKRNFSARHADFDRGITFGVSP